MTDCSPHLRRQASRLIMLTVSLLLLSACGALPHPRYGFAKDSAPTTDVDHTQVANAVPRVEPRSKYGNPKTYVVGRKRYTVRQTARGFVQTGRASWYGTKFHGHRTSSGEPYDMYAMTAAHKTLPIPSYVEVRNLENGRKIVVRVNDRGPFAPGRIIDLSYVAAKKLGITAKGTGLVEIRAIDPAQKNAKANTSPLARDTGNNPSTQPVAYQPPNNDLSGQLYLQVGAFSNRANASQLLNKLVDVTQQNVAIDRKASGRHSVYRVRIGPLRSEDEALKLRARLSPLGIDSPHLVVE